MTHTTPSGSGTIDELAGLNAIGVGTFSAAIQWSRWARVWSMSLSTNPISVPHASKRGLPKSAASASSRCASWATTSSRRRVRVATRHDRGLVVPAS